MVNNRLACMRFFAKQEMLTKWNRSPARRRGTVKFFANETGTHAIHVYGGVTHLYSYVKTRWVQCVAV